MNFTQNYWIYISGAITLGLPVIQWYKSLRMDNKKLKEGSINHLARYLHKPISEISQHEKLLLGEAVQVFYRRNLSVCDLTVLIDADNPCSAIDCFLRYRFYLKIIEGEIIYKKGILDKCDILSVKTPFSRVQVKSFLMYFFSAFAGLFLLYITFDKFRYMDFVNNKITVSIMKSLLESIITLGYSGACFFLAYISLDGISPPNHSYISRAFSGIGKSKLPVPKKSVLSKILAMFPFDSTYRR